MTTINYYLDKRRAKRDGTYPVKLRIIHNERFFVSTNFSAHENNWDDDKYTNNEPNFKTKNASLRNILSNIENIIFRLEIDGKLKQTSDKLLKMIIENELSGKKRDIRRFVDYMQDFIKLKDNKGTKSVYQTTINKILEYDETCTFDTMTLEWMRKFECWMKESGMKTNAYAIHLRNIRAVFNYAIDEKITTLYPFRKFKIKKEETRKRSLTVQQLATLRDYHCEDHQKRYRDIFMLMFYLIGINAIDLFAAKRLENERLEYKRAKTNKLYSIKVEPEAMEIINRYKGDKYLLNICDIYSNYKDFVKRMNVGLKQIGNFRRVGRGGKKERESLFPDISPYWARHTWATIAASLDIPKETISQALGHEIGSHVTSIYIDFDRRKIDEANRKVIDYLNQEQGL
ncbi:MAG: phage integrase SAM-like domain-containing protein [Bacteroides sp.]